MSIKIPLNKIQYTYTIGKEYMFETTYKEYQGYYYKINEKIFAGKEFNVNAPILIPIPKKNEDTPIGFNKLLANSSTYDYGKASGVKINNNKPFAYYFIPNEQDIKNGYAIRYFCQHISTKLIKEISEENYKVLLSNSIFVTTRIKCYIIADLLNPVGDNNYVFDTIELIKAKNQIPEIETFLLG